MVPEPMEQDGVSADNNSNQYIINPSVEVAQLRLDNHQAGATAAANTSVTSSSQGGGAKGASNSSRSEVIQRIFFFLW